MFDFQLWKIVFGSHGLNWHVLACEIVEKQRFQQTFCLCLNFVSQKFGVQIWTSSVSTMSLLCLTLVFCLVPKLPGGGDLYAYFVNFESRRLENWEKVIPKFKYNPEVCLFFHMHELIPLPKHMRITWPVLAVTWLGGIFWPTGSHNWHSTLRIPDGESAWCQPVCALYWDYWRRKGKCLLTALWYSVTWPSATCSVCDSQGPAEPATGGRKVRLVADQLLRTDQ